jgi:hypothetical protein
VTFVPIEPDVPAAAQQGPIVTEVTIMPKYAVFRQVRNAGAIGIFWWKPYGPVVADSMEAAITATTPDPDVYEGAGVLAEEFDPALYYSRCCSIARSDGRDIGTWPKRSQL